MNEMILWLAICLYHESRGEPVAGQIAVAHVIMNRVDERELSVKEIVLQPYQFSWANNGHRPPITDYDAFNVCIESAKKCLEERMHGKKLKGANHYFADYIAPPEWSQNMEKIKKIGRHIFYKG